MVRFTSLEARRRARSQSLTARSTALNRPLAPPTTICYDVWQDLCLELFPDVKSRFSVRCFNLGVDNRLRDLDPNDIDKLVSIKGMVTRTSNIIPDLKMGTRE